MRYKLTKKKPLHETEWLRLAITVKNHKEFIVWHTMRMRCRNKNNIGYKNYGGRGIDICERWDIFSNFLEDMGKKPEKSSLDRIDNEKGYSKENCRWATRGEQNNNTRRNVFITINNQTKTVSQWAKEFGIKPNTITYRIKRGWTGIELLKMPPGKK